MLDDQGAQTREAGPSLPAEVLGLSGTPGAGDSFSVVTDERSARDLAEFRRDKSQEQRQAMQQAAKLDNLFASLGEGEKRVLKLVVKADVRGSLEAIVQSMADLGNDEVSVTVLGSGVGAITKATSTWRSPITQRFSGSMFVPTTRRKPLLSARASTCATTASSTR